MKSSTTKVNNLPYVKRDRSLNFMIGLVTVLMGSIFMSTASFINSMCNTLYCYFNFTILYIHPSQNIELPESSVLKAYKCNCAVYM